MSTFLLPVLTPTGRVESISPTMNQPNNESNATSRREFIKRTSTIAAASALAGTAIPYVHAATDNVIRVGLVGCGGRGTGAAKNAMDAGEGSVKLYAMGDVFEGKPAAKFAEL